jgi:hypothetical protein
MRIETAIAKYTLIDLVLAEVVAATAVPSVLAIGKRVRGAAVERVPLRPCVLLRVGVLIGRKVLVGGGVVARMGIVRERSYADISNIRIINTRIPYLLSRRFS